MMVEARPIMTALQPWLAAATTHPIGIGEAPDDAEDKETYGVLFWIPGGYFYGSLSEPESDVELIVQVDSIGYTPEQAMWMGDAVRRTFLSRLATGALQVAAPNVSPFKINDRRSSVPAGGPTPGGEPESRVYSVQERFVLCITAA